MGEPHVARADRNGGVGLEEDVTVQGAQNVRLRVPEMLVGSHPSHVAEESIALLFLLLALHLAHKPIIVVHGGHPVSDIVSVANFLDPDPLPPVSNCRFRRCRVTGLGLSHLWVIRVQDWLRLVRELGVLLVSVLLVAGKGGQNSLQVDSRLVVTALQETAPL